MTVGYRIGEEQFQKLNQINWNTLIGNIYPCLTSNTGSGQTR